YKGVICLIALHDGSIQKGDKITLYQSNKTYEVLELGIMHPNETPVNALFAGQVGYIIVGMKTVKEAQIGDTLFRYKTTVKPFPGFKPISPKVFAGIYPIDATDFELLHDAIEKLILNDSSVTITKKSSPLLGLGFRCGFLGLLHMDVFKQRLEQEYNVPVIITAPSVMYKIKKKGQSDYIDIENPADFPDQGSIEEILEPIINATIITPQKYIGSILTLCEEKRGNQISINYLDGERALLVYELPLNEIATDFYDQLKSLSSGYASFDYEEKGYKASKLVRMDILINKKPVDALSCIVHVDKAYQLGKSLTEKLKEAIPRQLFEVAIQAAIGSKILARATVSAFRKDVTAKLYGGDVTRKMKLLEKQKAGKKRMKSVGNVDIPQEAFLAVLKK
ncbi:MAG: translation elongation factor 4, partial [Candidatus Babeliales bacterium]